MSNLRHGHARKGKRSPTFITWNNMLARCYYPKHNRFYRYGARGVTVCERWRHSFESFLADMGEKPDGLTLERVDTDGNYEKSNCKWATQLEQGGNKSNNRNLTCDGVTKTLSEWSRETNIGLGTLWHRWRVGWSDEMILKTPVK